MSPSDLASNQPSTAYLPSDPQRAEGNSNPSALNENENQFVPSSTQSTPNDLASNPPKTAPYIIATKDKIKPIDPTKDTKVSPPREESVTNESPTSVTKESQWEESVTFDLKGVCHQGISYVCHQGISAGEVSYL